MFLKHPAFVSKKYFYKFLLSMLVNNIVFNNTSTQNPQFKAFKLQEKTYKEANALIKDYAKTLSENEAIIAKNKLFLLLDKYLKTFAEQKTKVYQDYNNILQRMYLMFFEALEQFKNEENPIKIIVEKVNEFKHNADDNQVGYLSLGRVPTKSIAEDCDLYLADTSHNEPLSGNYREQLAAKKELKKVEEMPELTEENILLIRKRAEGKLYKEIGQELGISKVKAREKVLKTITKIQEVSGLETAKFNQIATELKNRLGLKKDTESIRKLVLKFLCLQEKNVDFLDENSTNIAKALGIKKEVFTNSAIEQPQVMLMKPETVLNNMTTAAKLLKIEPQQYIEAAIKQPSLMYQNPQSIYTKVKKTCKLTGISEKEFITMAIKNPMMFYQNPETLARKTGIVNFYKKIQNKSDKKIKAIPLKSDENLFSNCLKYLIAKQTGAKFDYTYKEKDLIEYLKNNPDKEYKFQIPKDKMSEDFIKYSTNLSNNIHGKNIFKFVI